MAIERQQVKEQDKFERRKNFDPVESNLTPEQVKLESSRCLHCKNPKCVQGCPVNIQIPDFIQALKDNDVNSAGKIIRQTSMLPSVCGRVCPQERQCESKCIKGLKGDAISIGALERYVADLLENIQQTMLANATQIRDKHIKNVKTYSDLKKAINTGNFVLAPWCNCTECEEAIKTETNGVSTRVMPFDTEVEPKSVCVRCGKPAKVKIIFAKAY